MRYTHVKLSNKRKCFKIQNLPNVWIVGCWASCGIFQYPFSGKYDKKTNEPLVWYLTDHNGACEEYVLMPISQTTTGGTICWTFEQKKAEIIARGINILNGWEGAKE